MKNFGKVIFSLLFLFSYNSESAFSATCSGDTAKNVLKKPLRIYHTSRLSTEKPLIDGKLNDACWQTGEWSGNYTQWIPKEGAKPSQPTQLKIFYDDRNIYVAIRAFDSLPHKIIRRAGRRDEFSGDAVGISFDSYHDHRTGFEFDVTAAGQRVDLLLTNPSNADFSWNAVWNAKTSKEDSSWTAEFEIPLSQLRYSNDSVQVWGLHAWRWIDRYQQESDWELQTSTGPGMLYLFGELHGINNLPRSRRIEVLPYMRGKLKTFEPEQLNPFAETGRNWAGNAGLDAKIGLASNFTADVTVNPDFGQVESDPSVMNLTAFETFYEEKRPFFLEGKNIFSFDFDNSSLFYSRRIGHSPSFYPGLGNNEFMHYPDNTPILGAVKLSGKTSRGFSLGILQSLTASGEARIDSLGKRRTLNVEPLTNYAVVRTQQDFKQGNTILGGIVTSTNRFINTPQLKFMNSNAYTAGLDLFHQWQDKKYYLDLKIVGSSIHGSHEAITGLQRSSAHYYQRPDIRYAELDTSLNQLSGYGGAIRVGKGSKGLWRYSTELIWRSPGLDLNDMGFMQMADVVKQKNSLYYFVNKPVSIFRTYNISLSENNNWDFGMQYLSSGANISGYFEFLNKWAVSSSVSYTSNALDTRILRGGTALLLPSNWYENLYLRTDPSKKLFCDLYTELSASGYRSAQHYSLESSIRYTPFNTLKLVTGFNYSGNKNGLQYITTAGGDKETDYVLGKIDQKTLGLTFRVDYNITPNLSLQYYGSPFVTVGKYSEFKKVKDAKAKNYPDRFSKLLPKLNNNTYEVSASNNNTVAYTFQNPDFGFSQFRSNLVFRWEFHRGAQFYLVWSQERTALVQTGDHSIQEGMSGIKNLFPGNTFLAKLNYWFSM